MRCRESQNGRISNPILIDVQQKLARVSELAQQSAVGIRVIKSFGRERELGRRFRGRADQAFTRSIDAARVEAFYQPFLGFLPIAGIALVLAVGGTMAINGDLSVGSFIEVYLLLALLMFPFRVLGSLVGNAQRAIAGGTRVFEVLDELKPKKDPDYSPTEDLEVLLAMWRDRLRASGESLY